ncbi:MAG: hypothetical protein ACO3A2_09800, partial [Bdellovibrionia bacterium]
MNQDSNPFLIDVGKMQNPLTAETRSAISDLLEFDLNEPSSLQESSPQEGSSKLSAPLPLHPASSRNVLQSPTAHTLESMGVSGGTDGLTPNSSHPPPSAVTPILMSLMSRILQDLEVHLNKLLSLNPSRRDSIAQHLSRLCGSPSSSGNTSLNELAHLKRWVEGPRTTAQNLALKTYFEEVAVIALGQALLLKSWSDRKLRASCVSDLGRLNWALSSALKPTVPLDREGWQITRPNLYSWYNPSPQVQSEIWSAFENWNLAHEGPQAILALMGPVRKSHPEPREPNGYDPRFFKTLWTQLSHLGISLFNASDRPPSSVLTKPKTFFTPTLRDGTWLKQAPSSLQWVGLEAQAFHLMLAELLHLWWGPLPPPLWSIGSGLEVHNRDQLALSLAAQAAKPSVTSRIAEMEAFDAAFVLEEHCIRGQARTSTGVRFRDLLDSLPYFKKIKSSGTTLGGLQACVALSKLRPGGFLLWMREENLTNKDGSDMLNFLLERAQLVCEWDFSELQHSLPSSVPLFPKHMYLFQRETNLEARLSHRPTRHSIHGHLRSHVELPLLLEDTLTCALEGKSPRGQWNVISHISPTPQRDWMEKWPEPTAQSTILQLDLLRSLALPLANFATVRNTPEGEGPNKGTWSVPANTIGFWVSAEYREGRRLVARPLPQAPQEAQGSGFLILVPEESWVAPLRIYLMGELIQKWLDHQVERRGDRWVLNEQIIKWLPVPKTFLISLGVPTATPVEPSVLKLPEEAKKLLEEIAYEPRRALEKLPELQASLEQEGQKSWLDAQVFIATARAMDYLQMGQNRLLSLVSPEGKIKWRELMQILPQSERISVSLHPRIRLTGSLPPHLPIDR